MKKTIVIVLFHIILIYLFSGFYWYLAMHYGYPQLVPFTDFFHMYASGEKAYDYIYYNIFFSFVLVYTIIRLICFCCKIMRKMA